MVGDVESSRLVERYAAGLLEALAGVLAVAGVDRVQAALGELAGRRGLCAGHGKADITKGAQSHLAAAASQHVAIKPTLRA